MTTERLMCVLVSLLVLVAAAAQAQQAELWWGMPPGATPQAYQPGRNLTPLPTFPLAVVTPQPAPTQGYKAIVSGLAPGDAVTLKWTDGTQWSDWSNALTIPSRSPTRSATATATSTPTLSPTFSPTVTNTIAPTQTPLVPAVLRMVVPVGP